MNLSSIKPNFSTANTANTLVQRDASGKMDGLASQLHPDGIHTLTAKTSLSDADELLIWDSTSSTLKRITKSQLLINMNYNNPVARYSGLKGSHSRSFIYGGAANDTNWCSTSGGNILITEAGTYRVRIAHGNVYSINYQASGTGTLRFVQVTPTSATVAGYSQVVYSGQNTNTACGSAGEFTCHIYAAANSTWAFEFVSSGAAYYGGGGFVEIEKLTA